MKVMNIEIVIASGFVEGLLRLYLKFRQTHRPSLLRIVCCDSGLPLRYYPPFLQRILNPNP